MSQYSLLSPKPNTTRMLRLLPDEDNAAPIKVQLFDYCLSKPGIGRHIYEALSYVWGSEKKPESIFIDNHALPVTENLHAALLHLRDHQLERMLWVDAICIDQNNDREKVQQILFMPMIYGQANRVIVWLGKAADHSSEALQSIRLAAEELSGEINHAAILMLLQRPWFRRIWVLQEVGLARSIMAMCGPVKMDGYTFFSGLERLNLSYEDHPGLQSQIRSVAYLMRGAIFRPEYTTDSRGAHSIGELIDMYHAQEATKQHDKVYALLGMSSDDPNTAALLPDYNLPWDKVLQKVIKYVLSERVSVQTWSNREMAVVKGRGYILGIINLVQGESSRYDRQCVKIHFNDIAKSLGYESEWGIQWTLPASAKSIEEGDIVCLLDGASNPSIIRLHKEYFTLIMIRMTPQPTRQRQLLGIKPQNTIHPIERVLREILLIWNWETSWRNSEIKLELPTVLNNVAPEYMETDLAQNERLYGVSLIVEDIMMITVEMKDHGARALEILLNQSGSKSLITERVVNAVVNARCGPEIITALLDGGGGILLVKAAVEDTGSYGLELMTILLDQRGDSLPISEEVIKVAAGNTDLNGHRMMELLLNKRGESLLISEEVVKVAAGNTGSFAPDTMALLLNRRGKSLPISEEVVKAAAGNTGSTGSTDKIGLKIMTLLLDQRGKSLPISEEVVKVAAGNTSSSAPDTMALLLDRRGRSLPISEEVVKVAAGNTGFYGHEIMKCLLNRKGKHLPISEEVVKITAGNASYAGSGIMALLIHRRGESLPISEEVVKAAAENTSHYGHKMMSILLDRCLPISEEVVKAVVKDRGSSGLEIMNLLLEQRGASLPISEEVVKITAENGSYAGFGIMWALMVHRGKSLPISEEVVKAAAGNTGLYGPEIMGLLLNPIDYRFKKKRKKKRSIRSVIISGP